MSQYTRSHLTDQSLLSGLNDHLRRESSSTAEVLADLAEVEERRIHLAAGYSSMSGWCENGIRNRGRPGRAVPQAEPVRVGGRNRGVRADT